ncbi:hypothetical protein [Methylobacillus methanolivorans]
MEKTKLFIKQANDLLDDAMPLFVALFLGLFFSSIILLIFSLSRFLWAVA